MTDPLLTVPPAQTGSVQTGSSQPGSSLAGDHQARFVRLLHDQILKLDQAELDFGLYRILNRRRTDIQAYLEQRLPTILKSAVGGAVEQREQELRTQLTDLTTQLNTAASALGMGAAFVEDVPVVALAQSPSAQKYQEARLELARLEAQQTLSGSELDQLYLHLLTFFSRYYQGGDYLPTPRRGRDRYLAPYGGQDTLFHWRSRGSHYVKTSTELRSYSYTPARPETGPEAGGPATIRFELQDAEVEQNNVKGAKRYFVPRPREAAELAGLLTLPFSYRPLTPAEEARWGGRAKKGAGPDEDTGASEASGSVQERLLQDLLTAHPLRGVDGGKLLLQARRYTRRNTSDFFVHPNLGPFLRRELDAYLLSEYLRPESLQTADAMQEKFAKYRALREAASGLIDFLHQLEDFQAQLFEKRKFVLRADYLLPVRLVPPALRAELLSSAAQVQAWQELFGLSLGGLPEAGQLAALEAHPTLVVDTRHHPEALKYQLLASYDDLEASLDGVLVHSENYGALRTLEATYQERVKLIYIDPPYNTGGDGFLYKDEFSRHSTWLSMMEERVLAGRTLLSDDGSFFTSIDENENKNYSVALTSIFGEENYVDTLIWQKVYAPKNSAQYFSGDHEYILVAAKNANEWRPNDVSRSDEAESKYRNIDSDPRGNWRPDNLLARNYYSLGEYEVISPNGTNHRNKAGTYWRVSKARFMELDADNRIWWGKGGGGMPALKRFRSDVKEGVTPQTLLPYSEVGHTQDAKREFLDIVPFSDGGNVFNTIKPKKLIERLLQLGENREGSTVFLDYFLGTGTSFDAFCEFKRSKEVEMRFVGVEMGDYFDQLTFKRIIRAMYSPTWKDGHPSPVPRFDSLLPTLPDWVERSPRLVQVLRLESFEDSLDALELPSEADERRAQLQRLYGPDYLLRYMLGSETQGQTVLVSAEAFQNPWAYRLRAGQPVDLPETFNLLLGLKVGQVRELHHDQRRYLLVRGVQHGSGERVLVIWRDVLGLDAAAERVWLSAQLAALGWAWTDFEQVYVNADSALPGARSLDGEFRRRMLARDEAFRALTGGGTA